MHTENRGYTMSLTQAAYLLAMCGVGGFFVGHATKKIAKILAITLGVFFLSVISLEYVGAFAINYERIVELISKLLDPNRAAEVLMPLIANLQFVVSFAAGFLIWLKEG